MYIIQIIKKKETGGGYISPTKYTLFCSDKHLYKHLSADQTDDTERPPIQFNDPATFADLL